MRKDTTLSILGFLIIITPFMGIPNSWKTIVEVAFGLLIVFTSLSLRHYLTRIQARLHDGTGAAYVESSSRNG